MVVRLEPKPIDEPTLPRLWLVFFSDGGGPAWWRRFFAPGWRHVQAAAWFAEQERWVWYEPSWKGTVIQLYRESEFDARLGQLATSATAILRVRSGFARGGTPATWHCVGAIKALLGVKTCALGPKALHDHLVANGAEIVEVPGGKPAQAGCSTTASGRPGSRETAAA